MPSRTPLTGSATTIGLVVAALAGLTVASLSATLPKSRSLPLTLPMTPTPASRGEVMTALTQIGLNAEALAAAGVSAQATTALVGSARTFLADSIQDLRDANADLSTAQANYDRLKALVTSGRATTDDVAGYATAQTVLATAATARQTVRNALFSAATAQLSSGSLEILALIQANAAHRLPIQYLTSTRTDAQWVLLRNAVNNLRVTTRMHTDQDPACALTLTAANGEGATSTAAANLAANLAGVATAWTNALPN